MERHGKSGMRHVATRRNATQHLAPYILVETHQMRNTLSQMHASNMKILYWAPDHLLVPWTVDQPLAVCVPWAKATTGAWATCGCLSHTLAHAQSRTPPPTQPRAASGTVLTLNAPRLSGISLIFLICVNSDVLCFVIRNKNRSETGYEENFNTLTESLIK